MVLPLGDLEKTRIVPIATYTLIALNVVMYLVQTDLGERFTETYAATPFEISHNEDLTEPVQQRVVGPDGRTRILISEQGPVPFPVWMTMITAMFLHGSPLHLAGNMLYLWIFGDNVEEVLGLVRYLVVYVTCGLVGTLAQVMARPDSVIPTLGASGAIAGVMGAYVVWFPHNRVRVLVFRYITEMPAAVVVGGWILIQLVEGIGSVSHIGRQGGVAYLAHVGGAATGLLVAWLFRGRAAHVRAMNEATDGWFEGP
jgi:membrane associated rhomboid family serine protease